jgi:hypothetical protein
MLWLERFDLVLEQHFLISLCTEIFFTGLATVGIYLFQGCNESRAFFPGTFANPTLLHKF